MIIQKSETKLFFLTNFLLQCVYITQNIIHAIYNFILIFQREE